MLVLGGRGGGRTGAFERAEGLVKPYLPQHEGRSWALQVTERSRAHHALYERGQQPATEERF